MINNWINSPTSGEPLSQAEVEEREQKKRKRQKTRNSVIEQRGQQLAIESSAIGPEQTPTKFSVDYLLVRMLGQSIQNAHKNTSAWRQPEQWALCCGEERSSCQEWTVVMHSLFSCRCQDLQTHTHGFISQVYYKIIMVHILHGICYLHGRQSSLCCLIHSFVPNYRSKTDCKIFLCFE